MKKERKFEIVAELKEVFDGSSSMVVSDYRGLDVAQMNSFRNDCRRSGIDFRVAKNTLARRALAETSFEGVQELFEGPTAIAVVQDDFMEMVKAVDVFSKKSKHLKVKGGVLDGSTVTAEELGRIAVLPSREELLARMVGSMNSPLSGLVGTLSGILRKFVGTLEAVRQSRGQD